jgi:Tol biopolymer transport system component
MKNVLILAVVISLIALIAGVTLAQNGQDLFQKALVKERAEGNLQEAIGIYKQVVRESGRDRALAAKALVQIGQCYEKLGNAEAQKAYQQVVRDYADQAEQVEQARARLAALKSGAAAPGRESTMTIRRVPSGTAGQVLDMYAKPSPDGKYLAYTDWKTGNLAILEVATGATRLLTKDGSWEEPTQYAEFSAWSRDSKRIAFGWSVSSVKESRSELRVVSLDGGTAPATIATPAALSTWPIQWARDGSRILCGYQVSRGRSELALIGVSDGALEKLNVELGPGRWLESQFAGDGNSVLYSHPADGKAAPHDIYLRNLRTGETTAVVQHPAEDLLVGVIPGTDWLLFASNRRGRLDLWGVQFRGGKTSGTPVLVEQGIGRFFPLGFTDDGRYYYATLSVTDDVFLADFDPETGRISGDLRKLASRWEGANMGASFSPDGEHLAYVTKRGPMPIPTHTADSLVVQSLKDIKADPVVVGFEEFGLTRVGGPCWAEDGRSIVLGGLQGKDSGLFRVDLPSLKKTKIYSASEGRVPSGHACSSHGRFVCLLATASDRSAAVTRIDIDGGNARELYRVPAGLRTTIAMSPDGKTVSIITMVDRDRRAMLVIPSEGGPARQIHEFVQPTGGGVSQTWSPDGKSIFYIVRGLKPGLVNWLVRRVSVEGGEMSEQSINCSGPIFYLQFHPNGKLVALTGRSGASNESEVWVIENLRDELKALLPPAGGKR